MQKLITLVALAACLGVALGVACTGDQLARCVTNGCDANNNCNQCQTGFQLVRTGTGGTATYLCQTPAAGAVCKSGWYAPTAVDGTTYTPIRPTCGIAQAKTDYTFDAPANTVTKANIQDECKRASPVAANTNYTSSAVAAPVGTTPANTAFSATPASTFQCIACPTDCQECDYNGTALTNLPAAGTAITGCSKIASGVPKFLSSTQDANGLSQICLSDITKYGAGSTGNNATACTACASTTNCTTGTCPTGFTYISLATLPGSVANGLNLTTLSNINGPFQGCYNTTYLQAQYGAKSASRASVAIAAVVAVVAAVFAF